MGAAGLTCSTCEMGARGGTGIEIDVSRVPQRETGMTPYEIMLSESQERMLLVVKKGREAEVEAIFEKWDLHAAHIGEVTERRPDARQGSRRGRRRDSEHRAGRRGAGLRPPVERPGVPGRACSRSISSVAGAGPPRRRRCCALLASPTIASKRWVYRQYDHMVRTNTLALAGMGAGVVRVKGTRRALAMSTDGNGRYCYLESAARRDAGRSPRPPGTSPAPAASRSAPPTA